MELLRDLGEFEFMRNALAAATVVAVGSAIVGWFAVLRRATFTVHTLAIVGFPGASLAALLGVSVSLGYLAFALVAAGVIAIAEARGTGERAESAVVPVRREQRDHRRRRPGHRRDRHIAVIRSW